MTINLSQNKENINYQAPYSSRALLYAEEEEQESQIEMEEIRIEKD